MWTVIRYIYGMGADGNISYSEPHILSKDQLSLLPTNVSYQVEGRFYSWRQAYYAVNQKLGVK